MNRNTFPFLALIVAAALFFWVRTHQKGKTVVTPDKATTAYTALRSGNKELHYSKHALCRMDCRHIDQQEVKEILDNGTINFPKIEESEKGVSYPMEGKTHEGEHLRIVFAPHDNEITVVTVIDLDKEWECDCK